MLTPFMTIAFIFKMTIFYMKNRITFLELALLIKLRYEIFFYLVKYKTPTAKDRDAKF